MTWAKICGLTHPDDVALCAGAGVDALGFVVDYPVDVPWNLTVAQARDLMALVPDGVQRVAVVGEDPDRVLWIADALRPDLIQLHADEDPATTAHLIGELHAIGVRVIKALRFDVDSGALITGHDLPGTPADAAGHYADASIDVLLVDSVSATRPAGTGRTVDLAVARRIRDGPASRSCSPAACAPTTSPRRSRPSSRSVSTSSAASRARSAARTPPGSGPSCPPCDRESLRPDDPPRPLPPADADRGTSTRDPARL